MPWSHHSPLPYHAPAAMETAARRWSPALGVGGGAARSPSWGRCRARLLAFAAGAGHWAKGRQQQKASWWNLFQSSLANLENYSSALCKHILHNQDWAGNWDWHGVGLAAHVLALGAQDPSWKRQPLSGRGCRMQLLCWKV